ncbi:hypothetical protein B0H11DRAFT_1709425, partial [Mycena galericulata]
LLSCDASPEVASLRAMFLEKLFNTTPNLRRLMVEEDSIEFFKSMVYERSTIALVAKFAHEVLQVFYAIPVFRLATSQVHCPSPPCTLLHAATYLHGLFTVPHEPCAH